ncbi:MAG: DUF58 domain-containing protein [Planctomycetaceae bacterium]|nr:DUF58 domain-containing protein [Planctomycetaceae bacterium]
MALSVEEYLRPEVIQTVQRLDLKARFIVEGFLSGLHGSPFQGFSVEFSEHRKYSPGDDIRQIDWSVFAKTDRFYIKKFKAETTLDSFLLMDCSASMGYSTGGRMSKMDYAICLAAALGYMMTSQQDSVGLVTFDEKIRTFLPPKSKRSHLMNILGTLARTAPSAKTNLAAALHEVADRVRKRGLIILMSDLLADTEEVIKALHHLRFRGHDLIIFQVLDYSEVTFDFDGQVRFREPETHEKIDVDPQSIRSRYLEAIQAFIDEYKKECLAVRADFVTVHNAMTFDKALLEFLIQRQATM